MTKMEFIDSIASKTGLTKADSGKALNAVIETIQEGLVKGDKIAIANFGTFEVRATAARKGHNPSNGETIQIPAGKKAAFKPSKTLKELIKK